MKRVVGLMVLCVCSVLLFAGVQEQRKTDVTFTKYGTCSINEQTSLSGMQQRVDTNRDAHGTGFMGKMLASMMEKGQSTVMTDLNQKKIYTLNPDKKQYTVDDIVPIKPEQPQSAEEQKDQGQDRYQIIRNELKAVDTGKTATINGFNTHQYNVIWILEKKEIPTGIILTDSLFVVLEMTQSSVFEAARAEQMAFSEAYLKAIGMEQVTDEKAQMLGLQWLTMLQAMDRQPGDAQMKIDESSLSKIQGYPVIIDGSYSTKKFDPNTPKEEDSSVSIGSGLGGMLGAAAQHAMTKKETKPAYAEQLHFRTELQKFETPATISADTFQVPAGYKEVKSKKK